MTDMGNLRAPSMGAVFSIHDELLGWLRDHALPLWNRHGVDRDRGGYFENLAVAGEDVAAAPPADSGDEVLFEASGSLRRGRVVARQIYVFDLGHRVGWRTELSSPVLHGCDYLFSRLHAGEGVFHTAWLEASNEPGGSFSLYEQAFYLFALARLSASVADTYPVADTAALCLARLRREFGKESGGFEESAPAAAPLKSNPHMHLLEAALEWIDVTEGTLQRPWIDLARELVGLCLTRFMDPRTGALREYFDQQWVPMPGDEGRLVEPGHQFEWAWLLMRWADSVPSTAVERAACLGAAERLLEIGERWGVDPVRGVAINEIWDDMTVKDSAAKLWPQTERLKAWCAKLDRAVTPAAAEYACQRILAAARGMAQYLKRKPYGLWNEVLLADGRFESSPSKASSFYHISCAVEMLRQTVSAQHMSVVYSTEPRLSPFNADTL